jgi:hypothetical protein
MSSDFVRRAFLDQAQSCEALGSPFTARLCRLVAQRLTPGNPVADLVLNWLGDPSPKADSVALRLAGCLHGLVLEGKDPRLVAAYPPNTADDGALWLAVSSAFETHADFILGRMQSAPQTNEVRRSGALLPGFMTLGRLLGKPLVLSEVGSSAGLNLQWDRYRYNLGGRVWGDLSSPVSIEPDWHGAAPTAADLVVAERAGCDLNPLDAADPDDCLRMLSYVWADQADRLSRTRNALATAEANQLQIVKADAIDWLKIRLATTHAGATHVIFHTIAWQYLPKTLQAEGEALIEGAGSRATAAAPLARLSLEADGGPDGASLSLQIWPTGEKRQIGRADFHGRWVKWVGWTE